MTDQPHPVEQVELHWPDGGRFTFHDEPDPHAPCYVVMPDGAMLPVNHWNDATTDIARAKWIIEACNEKLSGSDAAYRKGLEDAAAKADQ